jgi:hypothetical protein
MHKTIPVAEITIYETFHIVDKITHIFNGDHLPPGTTKEKGQADLKLFSDWFFSRGIPKSRNGLKDALEVLNIEDSGDLLLKSHGLSLSDHYWYYREGEVANWHSINYFENDFSPDVGNALFGNKNGKKKPDLLSPDNTSDGQLKKRWIVQEGKRLLVKTGSPPYYQEPLNEVIASSILKRLNIPHVSYRLLWDGDTPLSVCEDMVNSKTELMSAWSIFQTERIKSNSSKYQHYLKCSDRLEIPEIRKNLNHMLVLDFIIANTDRHFNNFGAIRDAETLQWLGPAPLFDNGTSLWHNQGIQRIQPTYKIDSKPFRANHTEQIKLATDFSWIDFQALTTIDEEFEDVLKKSVYIDKARRDKLCISLKARVAYLKNYK